MIDFTHEELDYIKRELGQRRSTTIGELNMAVSVQMKLNEELERFNRTVTLALTEEEQYKVGWALFKVMESYRPGTAQHTEFSDLYDKISQAESDA